MFAENLKPIGLFGGTFDPIHHGHLRLAIELYERLELAEVRIIPTARPPHREQPATSGMFRLHMVQVAIAGMDGLTVDDRELHRSGISYTVDTLNSLRHDYPQRSLCLIIGSDEFVKLPSWHRWQQLIQLAHLIIVQRPGQTFSELSPPLQDLLTKHQIREPTALYEQSAGSLLIAEIPMLDISATQIRNLLASGKNPSYLLPAPVLQIIRTHQLYCENQATNF